MTPSNVGISPQSEVTVSVVCRLKGEFRDTLIRVDSGFWIDSCCIRWLTNRIRRVSVKLGFDHFYHTALSHRSRWWRAPEIIVNWEHYNSKIDVWSVGCIMAELVRLSPLFPGTDHLDQLRRIISITGTPTEQELLELCQPGMFLARLTLCRDRHGRSELACSSPPIHPRRGTICSSGRLACTVSHFVDRW